MPSKHDEYVMCELIISAQNIQYTVLASLLPLEDGEEVLPRIMKIVTLYCNLYCNLCINIMCRDQFKLTNDNNLFALLCEGQLNGLKRLCRFPR